MNEFKIIKETINELEYQETNGLLTDRGIAYLKELKQALQLQQTGVSISVDRVEKYAKHQFNRGVLGYDFVEFKEWQH